MPIRFSQCEPMRDSRSPSACAYGGGAEVRGTVSGGATAGTCGAGKECATGGVESGVRGGAGTGGAAEDGSSARNADSSAEPSTFAPRSNRSTRAVSSRTSARNACRSLSCEFTVGLAAENLIHYRRTRGLLHLRVLERRQGPAAADTPGLRSYTALIEVHLTPQQQHQLAELAIHRGRDADALAQEAISRYLAEEAPDLLKPSSWARRR